MTILEVAKVAGVSHSTVSRVINGRQGISEATVQLVHRVIKETGYSPVPPALRRGRRPQGFDGIRTGNIAVVWFEKFPVLGSIHFIQAIQGISEALTENNLNMMTGCIVDTNFIPPFIKNEDIDGCIIVFGEICSTIAPKLCSIPQIWLSSRHTAEGDHVIGGTEAIGQIAADYLYNKGCRNLAFMNSKPGYPANHARGRGFQFAAFKKGLNVEMLEYSYDESQSSRAFLSKTVRELETGVAPLVERLLALNPLPDGIFIPQDRITAVVYRLLKRAGVHPGKDVTIISADNEEPYLAGLDPRPATIDIGSHANGRHAVEQLLWRMRHPKERRAINITIEPILIEEEQ